MSSRKSSASDLDTLCRRLGVEFTDPALLRRALTHKSASRDNNERLEFLGDAVLGLVIAQALYERFPAQHEDGLSLMRAGLVNGAALADIARSLELGRVVRLGTGELRTGGHDRDSILADALEAVFGAVLLDAGFEATQVVIRRLFADRLARAEVSKDSKTRLQEWLQARGEALPVYSVTNVSGAEHARQYEVSCELPGMAVSSSGSGRSRRAAEQEAAAAMLEDLDASGSPS